MATDTTNRWEWLFFTLLAAAAAALALLRPDKAIDFHVYWENARHYYAGRPMYGPSSGTGWAGGVYRYPPLFLDLFRPLALLPLAWGAALWAAGKLVCGGGLAIALRRRWGLASVASFWPGMLLVAGYFIQELRYGNAQFYIVALVMVAFLVADRRPGWGGAGLGLAAALKVWPLFFFPFLLARRQYRMFAAACGAAVGATLLPALWRGWGAQTALLRQWLAQERTIAATSATAGELWYPGQSLHDVLRRYLSVVDYSRLADANYRQVAWLHGSAAALERLWWLLALALVIGVFLLMARHGREATHVGDGAVALLFCALLVVEPHVHRLILETLLWPALWLAALRARTDFAGWQAGLYWVAVAAAALQPLVPGGTRQRGMQVFGLDFWLVLLPLTVLTASLARAQLDPETKVKPGLAAMGG